MPKVSVVSPRVILQWRCWPLQFQIILVGRRESRRVVNQTVGPGTRLPRPAVDSSSLECPVVSAHSSCHRGDLDVQLPVVPSTWALSVVSAVISGLCFNRSASSHAEGWLCGTFRHCLRLRFQLRFLALYIPAEAVNSLGYNCTQLAWVKVHVALLHPCSYMACLPALFGLHRPFISRCSCVLPC